MEKYVIKHKNINHLENTNAFLKYYFDINFKHLVFNIKEATHFKSKANANKFLKKFKHSENWEVIKYEL